MFFSWLCRDVLIPVGFQKWITREATLVILPAVSPSSRSDRFLQENESVRSLDRGGFFGGQFELLPEPVASKATEFASQA
jgi:hypothetical protein